MVISYVLIFSLLGHKEPRFVLPAVPFCFLLIGYCLSIKIKQNCYQNPIKWFIWAFIAYEALALLGFSTQEGRDWEPVLELVAKPVAPHSLYVNEKYWQPFYSMLH